MQNIWTHHNGLGYPDDSSYEKLCFLLWNRLVSGHFNVCKSSLRIFLQFHDDLTQV